jgi:two-component system, chemotaxis family, protein-glutamate methylesterase/glutaminase
MVIGASAGGLKALEQIARELPKDMPACLFVVMHIASDNSGALAQIIARRAALKVKRAEHGDPIEHGRLYVAPPDRHLLVGEGSVELSSGPRENRSRPALDPLFRSAALHYGARVAGVVLTGLLDDGTAGLLAIQRGGGVTIVQDPADAEFSGMPLSALARVKVDHCVPLRDIPPLLEALADGRKGAVRAAETVPEKMLAVLGGPDPMGHGLTGPATLSAQRGLIEHNLWLAVRVLEEHAALLASLAEHERAAQRADRAREYEVHEMRARKDAAHLRELLTRR